LDVRRKFGGYGSSRRRDSAFGQGGTSPIETDLSEPRTEAVSEISADDRLEGTNRNSKQLPVLYGKEMIECWTLIGSISQKSIKTRQLSRLGQLPRDGRVCSHRLQQV
jgi:hypothetical protein